MKSKLDLFLDSGAFSAWSKNIVINIDDYIAFVKKYESVIELYACLDVIGKPETTYKNQKYMESKGLHPLITFHNKEPYHWLEKYLNEYDYVALGGLVGGVQMEELTIHLDHCWSIICNTKDRLPRCKIHGFGLTSLNLMLRYPWYSVDSTSWVLTSRFGSVYVPRMRGGKYVYDESSWKVTVSSRSPAKEDKGRHIYTFSRMEQEQIDHYFKLKGYKLGSSEFFKVPVGYQLKENERWFGKEEAEIVRRDVVETMHKWADTEWLGFKKERSVLTPTGYREILKESEVGKFRIVERVIERGLSNDYRLRDEMNIIYFLDLEKSMPEWPWPLNPVRRGFGLGGGK